MEYIRMAKNTINRRSFLRSLSSACAFGFGSISLQPVFAMAEKVSRQLGRIKAVVIKRLDPDYEVWRTASTWYLRKPERYPDAIVLVESVNDIIEAVNYARENGLKVVSRGTGHASNQTCLRNGGLMLDLSRMRNVKINSSTQTADLEPGARAMDLLSAAEAHKLSFPAVHGPAVGMGGYLLGGGMGWNVPKWGIACRSIVEADIVLADGTLLTATQNNHADLLWAICGAGPGFFGVVTRFRIKLFPLPDTVASRKYTFTESQIPQLARTLGELMPEKDASIEAVVTLKQNRNLEPLPAGLEKEGIHCSVGFLVFADSESESRQVLSPFANNAFFKQAVDIEEHQLKDYKSLYTPRSGGLSNRRTNVDNMWTEAPEETLLAYVELIKKAPSPNARVRIDWGLNVMQAEANTSFPNFADHYVIITMLADEDSHVPANKLWMQESDKVIRKLSKGHYINEAEYQMFPDRIRKCFTAEGWERLGNLRSQYDRQGVFHNYLGY